MSVDDRIKQTTEHFKRLQADLGVQIEEFIAEWASAAEEERAGEVAEATAALAAELAAAKDDLNRAARQAEEARAEAERASTAEIARLNAEVDSLNAQREREQAAEASVAAAVSDERQAQMQVVERALGVVRRLDEAQSLSEILTVLAEGAAAEAPRVAVLTVQGDRVRSWRMSGFGDNPSRVDLARHEAGVVARALEQGEVAFAEPAAPDRPLPSEPGFAALPGDRIGLAIPMLVGGAAVAALYADDVSDVEQAKPAAWPEAIEIMVRHAALRLEDLTAVRTATSLTTGDQLTTPATVDPPTPIGSGAFASGLSEALPPLTPVAPGSPGGGEEDEGSARRYARLLVSEIKFYNEAAVRVGRQKSDLLERLREEIDRARKLYNERVPETVPGRHAFFEEELVQTLAGGDASLLGRRSDALA